MDEGDVLEHFKSPGHAITPSGYLNRRLTAALRTEGRLDNKNGWGRWLRGWCVLLSCRLPPLTRELIRPSVCTRPAVVVGISLLPKQPRGLVCSKP